MRRLVTIVSTSHAQNAGRPMDSGDMRVNSRRGWRILFLIVVLVLVFGLGGDIRLRPLGHGRRRRHRAGTVLVICLVAYMLGIFRLSRWRTGKRRIAWEQVCSGTEY